MLLDQEQRKLEGLYGKVGAVEAKLATQRQEMNSRFPHLGINLEIVSLAVYSSADEIASLGQDSHDKGSVAPRVWHDTLYRAAVPS